MRLIYCFEPKIQVLRLRRSRKMSREWVFVDRLGLVRDVLDQLSKVD
jgi:hypothetical protein